MLESITPQSLQSSSGTGFFSGLDTMATIQILLIQDYDLQLRHLATGMRSFKNVKQAYRKDIEALQQALLGATVKIDKKEYVRVENADLKKIVNQKREYQANLATGEVRTEAKGSDKLVQELEWSADKDIGQKKGKGDVVEKEKLQQKIDLLNERLDQYNEQSELTSLKLQSLTNQRKVAFEALSNLIGKQSDTLASIVRNIRG